MKDKTVYERAFEAALAYERNCIAKYDYPDWMRKQSRPQAEGDSMSDYAERFGVTVRQMKDCEQEVEWVLKQEQNG